jgi:hypothetical protein
MLLMLCTIAINRSDIMNLEVIAASIAGGISILGIIVNYIITYQTRKHERELRLLEQKRGEERLRVELEAKREEWEKNLLAEEQRWQESFRAELRRNLTQESTLEIIRRRISLYGEVWKVLKVTAGYEWRRLEDQKTAVKQLADYLTDISFGEAGLLMSDRSRRLLVNLRSGCGAFLKDLLPDKELIDRAHLLKHSLRSDLGIIDYEYESDLNEVAHHLGRVDGWAEGKPSSSIKSN